MNIIRTAAIIAVLVLPACLRAQGMPNPVTDYQCRNLNPAGEQPGPVITTCDGVLKPDGPLLEEDAPIYDRFGRHTCWPQVWGMVGLPAYAFGSRMAPNGVPFNPLFGLDFDFNIGLLPDKELYLFAENQFWTQKAAKGVTNPSQGQFDFSKREYDLWLGAAWTYYDSFELRVASYAMNNLNRGNSLSSPYGFKDGILLENRYYLGNADIFDVGRLSFLSLGYFPSKGMAAGDGTEFHPGLYARAYLTYDIKPLRSYVYFDGTYTGERFMKARLLEMDIGWAARPFLRLQNLEFRLGFDLTGDVQVDTTRNLLYGAVRINY